MPGRIVAFNVYRKVTKSEKSVTITTGISTSNGTGGAPLIELTTGRVLGVHLAGAWRGERGKFAYSELISKEVKDIVDRYLLNEFVNL